MPTMTYRPDSIVADQSVFLAAAEWVAGVLLGPVATSIAIMAVAWIGIEMLAGRLALRRACMVALGIFILFGSPVLARELANLARNERSIAPIVGTVPVAPPTARAPAPSAFDPYGGVVSPGG